MFLFLDEIGGTRIKLAKSLDNRRLLGVQLQLLVVLEVVVVLRYVFGLAFGSAFLNKLKNKGLGIYHWLRHPLRCLPMLMVKTSIKMPMFHITGPGFNSQALSTLQFMLMQSLEGDGSSDWVPDTHIGDPGFYLVQS